MMARTKKTKKQAPGKQPQGGVSEKSRTLMKIKETVNKNVRTLYIRFSENFPNSLTEIEEIHSEIKNVRAPRMAAKQAGKNQLIKFAFIEFENEEICQKAKTKLTTTQFKGKELFVDFVREKDKKEGSKEKAQINPTRLYVSGLTSGVTEENLKDMFSKSSGAEIPRASKDKGTTYGFIQFSNPEDAKSAFDDAKDLSISGHPITVLFATKTASEDELKKDAKRKAKKVRRKNKAELASEPKKDVKSEKEAMEEDDEKEVDTDGA